MKFDTVLVRFAIAVILAAAPSAAFASPRSEAKKHIDRAMVLHGQNKFEGALEELTAAYSIDPQPDLLYAIGQVEVKLDRCSDAITSYQMFIATNPKPGPAGAAREAIAACTKKLATEPNITEPKTTEPKPTEPKPTEPKLTEPVTEPKTTEPGSRPDGAGVVIANEGPSPWYKDTIGDALVAGGVVSGVVGIVLYRSASAKLDDSEHAPTYQASVDLVDSAHKTRTYSIIATAGGVALIGAGLVHYMLHGKSAESGVAIAPTTSGGLVTWNGRF
jgi:hypothetical protein